MRGLAYLCHKMNKRLKGELTMPSNTEKLFDLPSLLASNGGPLPLSRSGIYSAAANGDIPTVKIGKRRFVPSWFIEQLLTPPPNHKQTQTENLKGFRF